MKSTLYYELCLLRLKLDQVFSIDTSNDGKAHKIPSTGHCAAVALIVNRRYGGELVSAMCEGISHWFNRIDGVDIDLTGDQFGEGYEPVMMNRGILYFETRVRGLAEVNSETFSRSHLLEQRLNRIK